MPDKTLKVVYEWCGVRIPEEIAGDLKALLREIEDLHDTIRGMNRKEEYLKKEIEAGRKLADAVERWHSDTAFYRMESLDDMFRAVKALRESKWEPRWEPEMTRIFRERDAQRDKAATF
jgi:hypothetical protein